MPTSPSLEPLEEPEHISIKRSFIRETFIVALCLMLVFLKEITVIYW